jgi:PAS domain S-box-containing protein
MRGSQEAFKTIVDTSLDGIYQVDSAGKFIFVNESFATLFGYGREELLGKHFADMLSAKTLHKVEKMVHEVLSGKNVRDEVAVKHKDGHEIPVRFSATPLREQGDIIGLTGVLNDMTERKRMEEELLEAHNELEMRVKERILELEKLNKSLQAEIKERKRAEKAAKDITRDLRTVLENSVDMIYRLNLQSGTYDYLSPSSERVLGYTPEEFIALGFENAGSLIHPDDLEMLSVNILELIEHGPEKTTTGPIEYRINHKQLGYRWVSDNRSVIYDDTNTPVAVGGILRDITERRQAEQALRESEKNYRVLFESQIDGMAVVDAETMKIVLVNETALKMYGFDSREEALEANLLDYIYSDDRDRILKVITEDMFEKDLRRVVEFRVITKDGIEKWTSAVGTRIEYQGKTAGLASFRDITEQKQAEQALRESEEAGQALLNAPPDSAILTDRDGIILDLNKVAADRFGKSRDELIGVCAHDIVPPEVAKGRRAQVRKVTRSGAPARFEDERAGIIFDNTYYPVFDTHGRVARIAIFARDITEQRQAEQALQESEQKYRELVDLLPQIVYETDEKGNLTFVNRKAFESTGYTQDDIDKGLNAVDVFVPEDHVIARENIERVMSGDKLLGNEYTLLRKDGSTFPVISFSSPIIRQNKPVGLRGIVIDMTERKQAEKELRESEDKLRIIFDTVGVGITISDMAGTIVDTNETTLRMKGYSSKEEVLGLNGFDFVAEKDRARALEGLKALFEDEVGLPMEIALLTKDGRELDAECSSTILRDSSGHAVGLINVERDITERKQAEEALRESEARFRAIFDGAAIGIGLVNRRGQPIETNPALQKMLGYTTEELRSMAFTDYMHPEDATADMALFEEMVADKRNQYQIEKRYIRKDGQTIYGQVTLSAVRNADGKLEFVIGMLEDITERKQAEEELKKREEHFKALIENSLESIAIIDHEGAIQYLGPSFEHLMGYRLEEYLGKSPFDHVHPDDRARVATIFAELIQKPGTIVQEEVRVLHKNGSLRTVEVVGQNLLHNPAVGGIVANIRDVTERKRAAEALRQSEERHRSLFDNALDSIYTLALDGTITSLNPAFESVTGWKASEWIGKQFTSLVHPDDLPNAIDSFQRGYQGEQMQAMEARIISKSGQPLTMEFRGAPSFSEGQLAGYLGIGRDVTERRRMEFELRELYEKEKDLRQKVEVEMKRRVEFTRALAHELKTPLTSVLASSDLLVSENLEEPFLSLARNIRQGASNLNSRIDELLDLARGEIGMLQLKRETVDLSNLLREVIDSMTPLALERRQSIMLRLPPTLPSVQADTARLHQVVTNLLSNAIKFTPKDGEITLRARAKDASVIVEVQDTGRGIPKKEQERLFEPYQRLDDIEEHLSGLGLGLSLCKTLVELHGGQIWVRSHVGRGSTFGFSLPLETADRQAIEPEKIAKLWKVLIIEDDREIIDSVSLTFRLRWPEAQLISTGLGEEGIEMVEAEAPDIVILDLGLPDISGFEALRQIRLFSSVPVVILSVKEDESDMVKGLEWGADDYMVKPFKQLELLARLKVQLRKRTPSDEEAPIVYGPLRLDPSTFQLTYEGKEISLTIIEGRIIECLMRNAGHVVTHSRLAETVWGEDYTGALDSLRVYIRYLREKLELNPSKPKLILTKAGVGYSLSKPV